MRISTKVGDDSEDAWSDRHLQHTYLWLTTNQNSPYVGSPAMLLTAMKIDKRFWSDFRKCLGIGNLQRYRFRTRMELTRHFKLVLSGKWKPIVLARNKLGRVIKYEIRENPSPIPLSCPPFINGSVKITTKGLQLSLRRSEVVLAPKHDPEGVSRLTNAFGTR